MTHKKYFHRHFIIFRKCFQTWHTSICWGGIGLSVLPIVPVQHAILKAHYSYCCKNLLTFSCWLQTFGWNICSFIRFVKFKFPLPCLNSTGKLHSDEYKHAKYLFSGSWDNLCDLINRPIDNSTTFGNQNTSQHVMY